MEAPATSGSTPAASPAATDSPASVSDLRAALDGEADSSPPDEGDQDPSTETPGAETAEGEEASPSNEKKAEEGKPTDKAERRFKKLTAKLEGVHKEFSQYKQKAEAQTARLTVALKTVMGKLQEREALLAEYGVDFSSSDEKLADIERRQKAQAELSQHEKRLQEQARREQEQMVTEEAKAALEDALADALEEFPHLTDAQLRAKLAEYARENPDATVESAADLFRQFAREIDQDLEKLYEERVLKKHAPRLNAPKPIAGTGTMGVRGTFSSLDEIIEDAEMHFGRR